MPICLLDHLTAAAEAIEELSKQMQRLDDFGKELFTLKEAGWYMAREFYSDGYVQGVEVKALPEQTKEETK